METWSLTPWGIVSVLDCLALNCYNLREVNLCVSNPYCFWFSGVRSCPLSLARCFTIVSLVTLDRKLLVIILPKPRSSISEMSLESGMPLFITDIIILTIIFCQDCGNTLLIAHCASRHFSLYSTFETP